MNVMIIEDEPNQLELLKGLIQTNHPECFILTTADSTHGAVSAIKQYQPDLVFMDVKIKGGTSFDVLGQLPELDSGIVFTTSYEEYAIQAFRMAAIDYLLKPIDSEELASAIKKAKNQKDLTDANHHLKLLLANHNSNREDAKIALPTQKGYVFIKPIDIIRCESDNTYTTFFLIGGKQLLVSKTLKTCEQMLERFPFCRVHNSSLINLKHIESYERGEGGIVHMVDGAAVAVSRRRKDHFLQLFKI